MSNLNIKDLSAEMLQGFKDVASEDLPLVKAYIKKSSEDLARCLVQITELHLLGDINEEKAKLMLDIQTKAIESTFLTIEGMRQKAVNTAVMSALNCVKKTVNAAIGWGLIL